MEADIGEICFHAGHTEDCQKPPVARREAWGEVDPVYSNICRPRN